MLREQLGVSIEKLTTIKALVGINRSGYFRFLSKFWTASTSDRKIIDESQLVDLPEEGDSG